MTKKELLDMLENRTNMTKIQANKKYKAILTQALERGMFRASELVELHALIKVMQVRDQQSMSGKISGLTLQLCSKCPMKGT